MAKRHATRRGLSVGAALVTGLGTVGLGLFTAAPAQADVSNTLSYTCTLTNPPLGEFNDPWVVDLTVGVPEQVEPGAEIAAPDIKAEVTPGADASSQMRALDIKTLEGTSKATYTVGDGETETAELSIPQTDVPAEGPVTTVASGTAAQGLTAPSEDGELPIAAGDFTASLTTDTGFGLDLDCAAPKDNVVGAIQVGEGSGEEAPEENDWFDEPSQLPVKDNTFTVEGTAKQAGTLIIQVLDGDHEELTSYTWDVEEGDVSNTFELVEGADYVRILSENCVDANGDTEEVPGSECNVEYKAPWAADGDNGGDAGDGDNGGDTGNGEDTGNGDDQGQDTGDDQGEDAGDAGDDQGEDAGDAGQPQVPDVVQTDGGQMKGADSTNTALALGGLLLFGAGAGAVFAARRRSEQN